MTPHIDGHDLTPTELMNLALSWLEVFNETCDEHAWRVAASIYNDLAERRQEAIRLNLESSTYIGMVADDLSRELMSWT
jgi:hypothetical protein